MAAKDSRMEMQEIYSEPEESHSASDSDNTESDPDYDIIEDTQDKLSNLSIGKKGKACVVEGEGPPIEIDPEKAKLTAPVLDEKDEKTSEKVHKIIEAGELEKLKVLECKLYLRKNGLRLTGNKDTLIQRIREHLEIINGGGERKYPPCSFVLNCKGDACTGDVVLFEQNVYEIIASRSASGPPCGRRTVAGHIVKESYGAAKQQHTFTIEVLWSKGDKPLAPLYPLLIKGRNLYRLKTLRQRWDDEGERQKKLMEKHSRGNVARVHREARIQEKEKRKLIRENRVSNKGSSSIQSQSRPLMTESHYLPPGSINPAKSEILNSHNHQALKRPIDRSNPHNIDHTRRDKFCENYYGPNIHSREIQIPKEYHPYPYIPDRFTERPHHRKPLTSANHLLPLTQNREFYEQKLLCRYHAQGRWCPFGDNCKFSHDLREQKNRIQIYAHRH